VEIIHIYPTQKTRRLAIKLLPAERKRANGTLLVGSSIIRDINKKKNDIDMDPICIRGDKVHDVTERLLQLPKDTKLENMIIQVGSNDCCSKDFALNIFSENYKMLITVAESISNNVVLSGLCPRLDDNNGNISKGNICIAQIASDENHLYTDNDFHFRLLNGAVNISLYNRDGVHLNVKGVAKLAKNLSISSTGEHKTQENRRPPVSRISREQGNMHTGKPGTSGPRRQVGEPHSQAHHHSEYHNYRYDNRGNGNSFNRDRNQTDKNSDVLCWYCGEGNHVTSNCRHGTYLLWLRP